MEIQWVEEILHHQKDGWNMLKPYQLVQDKPPINWWFRNHPQYGWQWVNNMLKKC